MSRDVAAIRQLLLAAFGDEDFKTFCYDYFRPVYAQFTAGQTQGARVQLLLEYAERNLQIDGLLAAVERERPARYAVFAGPGREASSGAATATLVALGAPPEFQHVFGREAAAEPVLAALRRGEAVLLHGLAGIGKTALAALVARWQGQAGPFWEKTVWVDGIGAAPLAAVCDALARHFGDARTLRLGGAAKLDAVRTLLVARGVRLVVLDDVMEEATGREFLRACRPEGVAVLLTSRERWLAGEVDRQAEVRPLAPAAAVALFRSRSKMKVEEIPKIGVVCGLLGGHPLALELAAGLVASGKLRFGELQRRLGDDAERLRALALGGRSVLASLDLSVATLDAGGRAALGDLSACFGEEVGEDLLADVGGVALAVCADRAGELVVRSLAERLAEDRLAKEQLRLYQFVRDYGRGLLGTELGAVQGRVVAAAQVYARRYGGDSPEDYDQLAAERGTLLGALDHAAKVGDWAAAVALTEALVSESAALRVRGYGAEQVAAGRRAAAAARRAGKQVAEARLLHNTAIALQELGEWGEAWQLYEASLAIWSALGDQGGVASSLHRLGNLALAMGDRQEARRRYRASLAIGREQGDRRAIAETQFKLGALAEEEGDLRAARRRYEESLASRRRLAASRRLAGREDREDRLGVAVTLHRLGRLAERLGDLPRARRRYEEDLAIRRALGDRAGVASSLDRLGWLAEGEGDGDGARRCYEECLKILEGLGSPDAAIARRNLDRIGGWADGERVVRGDAEPES